VRVLDLVAAGGGDRHHGPLSGGGELGRTACWTAQRPSASVGPNLSVSAGDGPWTGPRVEEVEPHARFPFHPVQLQLSLVSWGTNGRCFTHAHTTHTNKERREQYKKKKEEREHDLIPCVTGESGPRQL
jgi:hypothetical protein